MQVGGLVRSRSIIGTSQAAEKWVASHLKRLLDGKVHREIRKLNRLAKGLTGTKRKSSLEKVVRYFRANVEPMQCDQCIEAGYPLEVESLKVLVSTLSKIGWRVLE